MVRTLFTCCCTLQFKLDYSFVQKVLYLFSHIRTRTFRFYIIFYIYEFNFLMF
jgi:hypothetical protein